MPGVRRGYAVPCPLRVPGRGVRGVLLLGLLLLPLLVRPVASLVAVARGPAPRGGHLLRVCAREPSVPLVCRGHLLVCQGHLLLAQGQGLQVVHEPRGCCWCPGGGAAGAAWAPGGAGAGAERCLCWALPTSFWGPISESEAQAPAGTRLGAPTPPAPGPFPEPSFPLPTPTLLPVPGSLGPLRSLGHAAVALAPVPSCWIPSEKRTRSRGAPPLPLTC